MAPQLPELQPVAAATLHEVSHIHVANTLVQLKQPLGQAIYWYDR
jgi:hypothetical protein